MLNVRVEFVSHLVVEERPRSIATLTGPAVIRAELVAHRVKEGAYRDAIVDELTQLGLDMGLHCPDCEPIGGREADQPAVVANSRVDQTELYSTGLAHFERRTGMDQLVAPLGRRAVGGRRWARGT